MNKYEALLCCERNFMKKIVIYGISSEIDQYSPKFMNKISCIVTEHVTEDNQTYPPKHLNEEKKANHKTR